MANAFEYPGTNYEQGNYDYFITEVKEFNRKLDEYQAEVNQKLSDQDEEIAGFKNTVNGQINQLRGQLADFEQQINQSFVDYKEEVNGTISTFEHGFEEQYSQDISNFRNEIQTINENISLYLEENLPTIVSEDQELQQAIIESASLVGWQYAGYFKRTATEPTDPTSVDVNFEANKDYFVLVVPKTSAAGNIAGLYFASSVLQSLVTPIIRLGGEDGTLLKLEATCYNNLARFQFTPDSISTADFQMNVFYMPLDKTSVQ